MWVRFTCYGGGLQVGWLGGVGAGRSIFACWCTACAMLTAPHPHDLRPIGISNLVTGAVGAGYTGSYIFSQTVFTMRQVRQRVRTMQHPAPLYVPQHLKALSRLSISSLLGP